MLFRSGDGLGDAFAAPLAIGLLVVDGDAFNTRVNAFKMKGKKGQKGWMSDSFSSELRSVDFITDGDAFNYSSNFFRTWRNMRKSTAFKRHLFVKKPKDKKGNKTDKDSFTTGQKQRKQINQQRSKSPEMDLFQKGVMPK